MPRILIVDDEDIVIRNCKQALPHFEWQAAFTWSVGWMHFSNNPTLYDAILLDGNLEPGRHGYTLAQAIRAHGYTRPLIAISGDEDMQKLLMQAGCNYRATKMQVPNCLRRLFAST